MKDNDTKLETEEQYYIATHWQLMWRKFKKHKFAMVGAGVLAFFYLIALFGGFFSTKDPQEQYKAYIYTPPQKVHFIDKNGFHFRPFVYGIKSFRDPMTLRTICSEDESEKNPIYFFTRGNKYKFWGLFPMDIHLMGVKNNGPFFVFGTDKLGRDLFSRNIYASCISLTIGLVGITLSFILGCILGGISGYFGGTIDLLIQRLIEFLMCIPTLPLWMGLSAALPKKWSPIAIYFGITIILSVVGWCGLARVVRGKILSLREEDYVIAARISNASDKRIIFKHLVPGFLSYLIVHITLSIPGMILGETALSFLGLGIQAPAISWGVLLTNVQNLRSISQYPWMLLPGLFIVIVVLAFNFMGDGIRDAADPYK